MHICLSSGSRPQYAHDVLRAIALPQGATLQFRYRLEWLSEDVRKELGEKSCSGQEALIAYIDQTSPNTKPEIIPIRYATILAADIHGSFVTLQFEIGQFAVTSDPASFNTQLGSTAKGAEPVFVGGKPKGKYWFTFEPSETLKKGDAETQIEWLTQNLGSRRDFEHENVFYTVLGIYDSAIGERVKPTNGEFLLEASHAYYARLIYQSPRDGTNTSIVVSSSSSLLSVSSNPTLQFSSRYDSRDIFLATGRPEVGLFTIIDKEERKSARWPRSVLSFAHSSQTDADPSEVRWDFDLWIAVNPDVGRAVIGGILIGMLAASPAIVPLYVSGKLESGSLSAVLGLGAIAGICAVFGLRRPT